MTTTSVRVSPYRHSTLVCAPGAYRATLVSASRTMPYAASATAPSGKGVDLAVHLLVQAPEPGDQVQQPFLR